MLLSSHRKTMKMMISGRNEMRNEPSTLGREISVSSSSMRTRCWSIVLFPSAITFF